jgi:hypothetical protein
MAPGLETSGRSVRPNKYIPNLAARARADNFRRDGRKNESLPVSLTILYRHPHRPDEAGMTVVADRAKAAAMTIQLELRGFQIIKIVPAAYAKTVPAT